MTGHNCPRARPDRLRDLPRNPGDTKWQAPLTSEAAAADRFHAVVAPARTALDILGPLSGHGQFTLLPAAAPPMLSLSALGPSAPHCPNHPEHDD